MGCFCQEALRSAIHMFIYAYMNTSGSLRDAFAALSDGVRLELACCLSAVENGLCVCELVEAVRASQPNVSRHLRLMKAAGLVEERREGKWMYYRMVANHPFGPLLRSCIRTACCAPDVGPVLSRLERRLELREDGKCVVGMRAAST